jgi:16S rRNA processing protein RimM
VSEPGAAARYLAVGRLRKPHGLKGEFAVFPLTAEPDAVFAAGKTLVRLGLDGTVLGEPVKIERSRPFHREWLIKFRGSDDRDALDSWRGQFLGAPATELAPLEEGEVYLHELEGFAVKDDAGMALGLVTSLYELPSGLTLEIQGPKREFLLPFRKEFVLETDRAARVLVVRIPDGLLE